jgi:hypothetical protein
MFRSTDAATAAPTHGDVDPAELIPLSHLALDLDQPSVGWAAYLTGRGIEVVVDDIGRPSVSRSDARQLFDERREAEARQAAKREAAEREAIERDQQFRSQLWTGVSADYLPADVAPAAAMLQAARDARPKRLTPLQEALSNSGTLTHYPCLPRRMGSES